MADKARALKLAGTIKKIVARALQTEIKDPRLAFVTITDVRVTGDLQQASIFYTVMGGETEREDAATALAKATGRLRSIVGSGLGIRLTPTLEFHLDAVPETAASLDRALHEAHQRDEELKRLRENARYAGDEDPYKHPDEDQD